MSNERTPLLRGYVDGASEAPENDAASKYSKTTRYLRLILIAALAALVVAFITVISTRPLGGAPAPSTEDVCTTAGCVLAAASLLQNLSPRYKEIDPCEDFESYVCEGWQAKNDLRPDQSRLGTLQVMSEDNEMVLKHILESPSPNQISLFWTASSPDQEIFDKLQNGYSACMNETRLQSIGVEPLLDLLYKLQDIYRWGKKSSDKDHSLTDAVAYLMSIGTTTPIDIGVVADDRDPDTYVIAVSPPYSFKFPKQYFNRTDIVSAYADTIEAVFDAIDKKIKPSDLSGAPLWVASNKDVADRIISFESRMAAATPDVEDLQDITKTYNPRSLEEADSYNKHISLKTLIKRFAHDTNPNKIIVASEEYLQSVSDILGSQKRETIFAYLVWKVIQTYAPMVEDDTVEPLRRFNNKLNGQGPDVKPDRWRTCLSVVNQDLPWILSRFFVERAFSKEAKDLGDQVVHDIKDQFKIKLNGSEWMSKETRQVAIDKVDFIRQKIGYPTKSPDVTNAGDLQKYYEAVPVHSDTFFANRLSSKKDVFKRNWAHFGKPVDKDEWGMSANTVNAYYNPSGNEIVFPAGIMQAPVFFDLSRAKYLSYGAFGAVAGHELSHAFDSLGSNYDQNGNYTDWWDESTVKAFKKKTECFVEQYHNYSIPTKDGPLQINGRLALGENIADAGGLTAAYQSWVYRDSEQADLLLPGLQDFSKEQLFFLAYGTTWCYKSREEDAVKLIYADPHSPPKYRILGTTANSREFRQAFNCPVKEPTCEIW